MKKLTLVAAMCMAAATTLFTGASLASNQAQTAPVRWTFDGQIRNNTLALSPDERTAVVAYSQGPELIVYDLDSGKVRAVLDGFVTPRNIVFSPAGDVFYVSDSSLGTVSVIHTADLRTLRTLPVGFGAFGTTLSKDGSQFYVNNQAASTVTSYDLQKNYVRAVVPGFAQPRQGVRLSPDGKTLYVTNFLGDKITIVDTATDKITGEIKGFNKLRAISVSADGNIIFAANSGSDTLAVVDVGQQAIVTTIPVGQEPYGAALTPDGQFVYVGNLKDNSVSVVSVPQRKVVATVTGFQGPRQATVFTRDNKLAYVLNEDLSLAKVDRASHRVVETLAAPAASR